MKIDDDLPDDAASEHRRACAELERRLSGGERCRAEDLLAKFTAVAAYRDLALNLALTEFHIRRRLGQAPAPEEWYGRFPQWREELRRQLEPDRASLGADPATLATVPALSPSTVSAGPAVPPAPEPKLFAHYRLLEELGRGGMGVVHRAWDTVLGREVALKRLRPGALDSPELIERFSREARAAARLRHRHIVPVLEFAEHDGQHYFTMPLVQGGSLGQDLGRFADDPRAAAVLLAKVARAIHVAHEQNVVHRDLKPANIFLDEQGEPLVGDFGLVKFLDAEPELTRTGQVLGTPAYMAPEQLDGRPDDVTPRTDVWALGAVLYVLLTGQRPFPGRDSREVSRHILQDEPPRPRQLRPRLDRRLETIALKCLAKEPGRRYPSARELADDLERWLDDRPIAARPEPWFERAWRRLRGRPVLFGLLLLGLAPALLLAPHLMRTAPPEADDERTNLNRIQVLLEQREPLPLLGEQGRPLWSRWALRQGGPIRSPLDDDTFTLTAQQASLLELVPAGRWPYRFCAEVRHHNASKLGVVGIYFAYIRPDTSQGTQHCYCTLTFSDISASQLAADGKTHVSWAALEVWRHRDADDFDAYRPLGHHEFTPARLAAQGVSPWRRLEVIVSPDSVAAFWEGVPLPPVTPADVRKEFQLLKAGGRGPDDCPELDPQFGPRGGLGLCVSRSEASFRRVAVEPPR
jgi:serine/threonine-protein kinase